jgi:hypothetical protein
MGNEYRDDLKIDPLALDKEWLEQPSLYMKYAKMAADASADYDRAKENVDIVKAQIDNQVRQYPEKFKGCPTTKDGALKPTEGWIISVIFLHDDYAKANERYHKAKLEMNVLQAAVRAFDHRKKALEMEVSLWFGGYNSSPDQKKIITKETVKRAGGSSDKQRDSLTLSRKRSSSIKK